MNDVISIIIPTFNRADSLPDAIGSVLEQSAGNWELIIVDDGSIDDTRQVMSKFLSDERVKYYFQENAGVSAARNKGVELSRGDYLIFLDSDDKFLPGIISRLNKVDYSSYDLICWQVSKLIDGKYSVWKPQKLEKIYKNIRATFLAGSICYKKEVFLKAGGYDTEMSFGENYELGIRIGNLEKLKIKIINESFLLYRIQTKSRTSDSIHNKLKSNKYLLSKHKEKYKKDPYSYSRLKYQMAYLNERSGNKEEALELYREAWSINLFYFKAFLKTLWLSFKFQKSE
ncbi:glycosyltransferase family 2 protein [Salegentibacter flavus]|uniref:Glycosyltransferase involved in cell wall bisynthesis n=1 Tax=Salegentibacter flavus TaxID=287099 RepID=A0A1I5BGN6_9FLAO|nr:glycosyltransferase family A protein [Salegentibacter flavus]SFN73875.1 Glycosyltransferase involved in cell wall bisynthesis [Salegentibacter flavus]